VLQHHYDFLTFWLVNACTDLQFWLGVAAPLRFFDLLASQCLYGFAVLGVAAPLSRLSIQPR